MDREQKITLARIVAGALLMGASYIPAVKGAADIVLCLAAYILSGADVLWEAVKNIFKGELFDENFLMSLASVGAIATGQYAEAAAVMLLYGLGELLQDLAVEKSRASVSSLMDLRPDYANLQQDGTLVRVSPESVQTGSIITVKPGEKIPLDGVVVSGSSTLNTCALTGESMPRDVAEGESVMNGCVNLSGLLQVRTTGVYGESTVAKILRLVEESEGKKAKTDRFISRFARVYTPAVVACAVALAVIPSLITGDWVMWLRRALIFLVISCPCALVISIPLGFYAGIGGASRMGILVKGSGCLEAIAGAETVVFDKTGTLTKGSFAVTVVHPQVLSESELLQLAALAESYSDHPISQSIREACKTKLDKARVSQAQEIAGQGVSAVVDGRHIYAGNSTLMESIGAQWTACEHEGTIIHVAADGAYAGHIVIEDEPKPQSKAAIAALKAQGVRSTVMLTGDREAVACSVAENLGIDEVHAQLLPTDKVALTEQLLEGKSKNGKLLFVGDGINDAPVLKRADVGIAMGAIGSDAAIEAADVVLMDDNPEKVAQAIGLAKRTMRIVVQNIVFALSVKLLFLLLGALGYAGMWHAVFADVGVSMLAVLNALRAMSAGKTKAVTDQAK